MSKQPPSKGKKFGEQQGMGGGATPGQARSRKRKIRNKLAKAPPDPTWKGMLLRPPPTFRKNFP